MLTMKIQRYLFIFFWMACSLQASILGAAPTIPRVLVSVAPHKFFVEKVAGESVVVDLMVPAGASSHTFEPTPKQMLNASHADIWFQIGEGFEPRASKALIGHHPEMQLIDLRKGVDLIYDKVGCCQHHRQHAHGSNGCIDPHFWLSLRQAKIQAKTIADSLSACYPQNAKLYEENLAKFTEELQSLDGELTALLTPLKNRVIAVSHPAYAYFCRDYSLHQLSIEFEGKDPSPRQLTNILTQARRNHIKTIFIQMQYNSKGARLIAHELGANIVTLDPYAEQYFSAMRSIAQSFASQTP